MNAKGALLTFMISVMFIYFKLQVQQVVIYLFDTCDGVSMALDQPIRQYSVGRRLLQAKNIYQ